MNTLIQYTKCEMSDGNEINISARLSGNDRGIDCLRA
jgi:hypothetical protein